MTLDPQQARQLEILGYTDPESRVRVRCFVAKGMPLDEQFRRGLAWAKDEKTIIPIPTEGWLYPNKGGGVFVRLKKKRLSDVAEVDGNGNPIWIESSSYQDGTAYLCSLNAKGYGVYILPNAGGGADVDITRFPALFYECDGITKTEQWDKLRSLEYKLGRSASSVVETRNSLHCYFKLISDSVLPSTWTQYQQRLIQEQGSDPAIWNPARLMRLAGFDHQKWNAETKSLEQFQIRLVQENDNSFSLDEFDKVLPEWSFERWSGTQRTSERIATDPTGDPWDIRNFAHYLDSYQADGRRGWDTCKCPAHNGQTDNSLHVEQVTGAFKCHAGCEPKDVYHAALELAKSRGHQVPQERTSTGHRFSDLGTWLFKLKKQLAKTIERRSAWGFARKENVEHQAEENSEQADYCYPGSDSFGESEGEDFTGQPVNERLRSWSLAHNQGKGTRHILDISGTGTGKSFDTGLATPSLFGTRQIIYLSNEHRNPSTPTLKSWPDLEARHKGLYRDDFGKLRRVKSKEPYVVAPNCSRNETISALRSKNIGGADAAALICMTCKNREQCQAGFSYSYLYDRSESLKEPKLRAHPQSLPDPVEYDYSKVLLVWDEASELIKAHHSINVTAADLDKTIAELAVKLPGVFDELRPLLSALRPFLSGEQKQPNKYGWKDFQIREALPKDFSVNVEAIRMALIPELNEFLNPTREHGVDLADLPPSVRKKFSVSDEKTAEHITQNLPLNWLPDFLDVLLGRKPGNFRIQYGCLTIAVPNDRLREIAQAASGNVYLDATLTAKDLALLLGIEESEILTMQQETPDTGNLEIVQVATMGRLGVGSDRSEFCQKRIDALVHQITADSAGKAVTTIDFKRFTTEGDGKRRWWVDSRGINDLEASEILILVGTPCRSLAELEAEFAVLHGRSPVPGTERVKYPVQLNGVPSPDIEPWFELEVSVDPEFREFCRRRILADIRQAIGRLRAHRRAGQKLQVYFIADYPLDLPVTLRRASDFTPEAATKVERVEIAIRAAVQQLKDAGLKITQQAIAQIVGVTQGYVSRFQKLLQTLLNPLYSKSNNSVDPPPDPGELEWMSREYLPLLGESPPDELLLGVLTTFEAYSKEVWQQIWEATPASTQIKILQTLMFILPPSELRALYMATGGIL